MEMTFEEYANNPMGKANAVYSHREMWRKMYAEKLDKLFVRETGKINYTLWITKDDVYYAQFKIPSEEIPGFYYDTVIKFYNEEKSLVGSRDLKKYKVKFYSNDGSFVYTFAHAMLENDLFIRELVPRMDKMAVKQAALKRNKNNEIGYVKSIYFAYLLMTKYGLWNKSKFKTEARKYNKRSMLEGIMKADAKLDHRKIMRAEKSKAASRDRRLARRQRNDIINQRREDAGIAAKRVTGVKVAKRAKKAKRI